MPNELTLPFQGSAATPQSAFQITNSSGTGAAIEGIASRLGKGISGSNDEGTAVNAISKHGTGMHAESQTSDAVFASSQSGNAISATTMKGNAINGFSQDGVAIEGRSFTNIGIRGTSDGGRDEQGAGVQGVSTWGAGVCGINGQAGHGPLASAACGVRGTSASGPGIIALSDRGVAIMANSYGGKGVAGQFEGDVNISQNLNVKGDVILAGADCAEQFDSILEHEPEPGTVVIVEGNGTVRQSDVPYDKRVAGVVSGAGEYRPGVVLDGRSVPGRIPIALIGKVYCKVDAQYGSVEVGDLLTSSPTPGFAMKAADPMKAFGAVVGKALRRLSGGTGIIPILVALQ